MPAERKPVRLQAYTVHGDTRAGIVMLVPCAIDAEPPKPKAEPTPKSRRRTRRGQRRGR